MTDHHPDSRSCKTASRPRAQTRAAGAAAELKRANGTANYLPIREFFTAAAAAG